MLVGANTSTDAFEKNAPTHRSTHSYHNSPRMCRLQHVRQRVGAHLLNNTLALYRLDVLPNISTSLSTQWTRECLVVHNTSADYSGVWMRRITCAPTYLVYKFSVATVIRHPPRLRETDRSLPPWTVCALPVKVLVSSSLNNRSTAQPPNRPTA